MRGEIAILVSALNCLSVVAAIDIKVDFSVETGRVKLMHSTGQGPMLLFCDFSMFKYLKDAGEGRSEGQPLVIPGSSRRRHRRSPLE